MDEIPIRVLGHGVIRASSYEHFYRQLERANRLLGQTGVMAEFLIDFTELPFPQLNRTSKADINYIPTTELGLDPYQLSRLNRFGVKTVGSLVGHTGSALCSFKAFGKVSLGKVIASLGDQGLQLRPEDYVGPPSHWGDLKTVPLHTVVSYDASILIEARGPSTVADLLLLSEPEFRRRLLGAGIRGDLDRIVSHTIRLLRMYGLELQPDSEASG